MKKCEADGCSNIVCRAKYCRKHYLQIKRHGFIKKTIYDPNEILYDDNHTLVMLYDKNLSLMAQAKIDLDDVNKISRYKWYLSNTGYATNDTVGTMCKFIINPLDNKIIDHINGDRLDNRKKNLRECSYQENNCNKAKMSSNTSGYTGVSWNKKLKKWESYITNKGKRFRLGLFSDIEKARNKRNEYAKILHGAFAKLS